MPCSMVAAAGAAADTETGGNVDDGDEGGEVMCCSGANALDTGNAGATSVTEFAAALAPVADVDAVSASDFSALP